MMGNWFGGIFGGLGLLMVLTMAAFYIIFLVAAWRLMRAHELLAGTLKDIAESLKSKNREP